MNFSNGPRGWEKSKAGEGGTWEEAQGDLPCHPGEQHVTPSSFLRRATASRLRGCKGAINPPCNDVITLMDAGPVEHFISTRAS